MAYDSTGASTSTQIGVNMQNGTTSSTNTPPTVSILKPDGGASSSTQRAIRNKDYAKFGYYNWTASSRNGTARKVLLRSPMIVSDPTGQTYSLEQISALLGSMM